MPTFDSSLALLISVAAGLLPVANFLTLRKIRVVYSHTQRVPRADIFP